MNMLRLFGDMAEQKRQLVQIAQTNIIALSFHEGGSAIHILFIIMVDDKGRNQDDGSSWSSMHGLRLQNPELLWWMALIINEEASLMDWKLFHSLGDIFKGLWCNGSGKHRARFGLLSVILADSCLHVIPLVPSGRLVEEGDRNGRYVMVCLLDEYKRALGPLGHIKVVRITTHVPHSNNLSFGELLVSVARGKQAWNTLHSLKAVWNIEEACKHVFCGYKMSKVHYVHLKKTIFCLINVFIHEHNGAALKAFPRCVVTLYPSTIVKDKSISTDRHGNAVCKFFMPAITCSHCPTGIYQHHRTLKKAQQSWVFEIFCIWIQSMEWYCGQRKDQKIRPQCLKGLT